MEFKRVFPVAAVAALALGACSSDVTQPAPADPSFYVTAAAGEISLCKQGPPGSWADFTITSTVGAPLHGAVRLQPSLGQKQLDTPETWMECILVWDNEASATVTITEVAMSPGTVPNGIIASGTAPAIIGANAVAVQISSTTASDVRFKNIAGETPPPAAPVG